MFRGPDIQRMPNRVFIGQEAKDLQQKLAYWLTFLFLLLRGLDIDPHAPILLALLNRDSITACMILLESVPFTLSLILTLILT